MYSAVVVQEVFQRNQVLTKKTTVAGHQKWTVTKSIIKADPLTTEKLPKNSMLIILWSFGNWRKLVRWKSLISGCILWLLFSHSVVSDYLQPHGLQHVRLPCPSPSTRACSKSCPLSQWCHTTILSSVIPFSFWLRYFPASGSFLMSWLFALGGQSIGASASVLPMNSQRWFPLGLTGLISLQSKGLSRVFSNTTVQKHQFFNARPSLWSNSHIHT